MASIREIRKAYEAGIRDGLRDTGNVCLTEASRIIAEEATDRGALLSSGEVDDVQKNTVTVRWPVPQAKWVNWGTAPHWPPFAPILAWVKRNLRRFTETGTGRAVDVIKPSGRIQERTRKSPDKVAEEVARAIQAKIARDGTAPVYFAQKGARVAQSAMPRLLKDAVDARLSRLK